MTDQAAALRNLVQNSAPELISSSGCQLIGISSGKGGVGKTHVVINLALALSRAGKRVAIFDADFGLANVDVFLGLTPSFHIGHVAEGLMPLHSIILNGPEGVDIIPASSGIQELAEIAEGKRGKILEQLNEVLDSYDYILIDTAAGISSNVIRFLAVSKRVIVVSAPEPTAIVDAYALIKVLLKRDSKKEIWVLVNSVRNRREAESVFTQLNRVTERYLGQTLRFLGFIPLDDKVRESVRRQQPLLIRHPKILASRCFAKIAETLISSPPAPVQLRHLWEVQ